MVSVIGRKETTEANASFLSLEPLGTCSSFQSGKQLKHFFFTPRDVFRYLGVSGLEFLVNLSDHQLGVTLNQVPVGKHGGRQFEPC